MSTHANDHTPAAKKAAPVKPAAKTPKEATAARLAKEATAAAKETKPKAAKSKTPAFDAAVKATEKKATKTAPKKVDGAEPRVTAASRTREMIMEGKLTDDGIHAQLVKEGYDVQRKYIGWYRSDMRRKGVKNVPDAVKAA